jgi:hypothetical protein
LKRNGIVNKNGAPSIDALCKLILSIVNEKNEEGVQEGEEGEEQEGEEQEEEGEEVEQEEEPHGITDTVVEEFLNNLKTMLPTDQDEDSDSSASGSASDDSASDDSDSDNDEEEGGDRATVNPHQYLRDLEAAFPSMGLATPQNKFRTFLATGLYIQIRREGLKDRWQAISRNLGGMNRTHASVRKSRALYRLLDPAADSKMYRLRHLNPQKMKTISQLHAHGQAIERYLQTHPQEQEWWQGPGDVVSDYKIRSSNVLHICFSSQRLEGEI